MPYNKEFIVEFSNLLLDTLVFLTNEEKKVIILDCDNTLWNGILGEDGINGVFCDKNVKGNIFYQFQRFLKAKKTEGFLLCLCSKNNESDVKEIFENKNMPLRWNDFILKKVNWEEKYKNIIEISSELNLNESSFIFIDDNEFELNSVKSFTNVNAIFNFRNSYEAFLKITENFAFKRKKILTDDIKKTESYLALIERSNKQNSTSNFEEYLKSLEINLNILENDVNDFDRLSQLTQKTNQFNLNKKDYSKQSLYDWISRNNLIFSLKLSDIYGDYGTVGLLLIEKVANKEYSVSNFIMSCRALGKKVEYDFFKHVTEILDKRNIKIKEFSFKKSDKNKPAEIFLQNIIKNGYRIKSIE